MIVPGRAARPTGDYYTQLTDARTHASCEDVRRNHSTVYRRMSDGRLPLPGCGPEVGQSIGPMLQGRSVCLAAAVAAV